ncbi:glycoside hydrolase family 3 protein [Natronosporangium hydrolyticum]|uniref:Glycoside hydrolase family 3 protein n=1 Tax=Natronosporangium hydrolyticum TaxID=2811111 RepID=A0A895YIU1_9ACTN|nr:glycoside hydrolase family 3 N-terminal domain-containing protein [Natronosporangium hydrolyticum]QSB15952.1 glycoside hydrolase family 3 protein [Natronosporangium hydrolyticum]
MATDPGLRRLALRTLLAAFPGTTAPDWARRLLEDGLTGYTFFGYNVADADQLSQLTAQLRDARNDVLIAIDEEGGDVTRLAHRTGSPYPGNAALGVVADPAVTQQVYQAIGNDLASVGVNLDLAPTVDVNTADDNPIIGTRSFGADPGEVARHTAAAVAGLQRTGVAACAKHFPGHGATVTDSHLTLPRVDATPAELRRRDLPPFAAAIEAGAKSIMTAHIVVPALTGQDPATFSSAALVTLLREEYGFTGAIITDALEMAGAAETAGSVPAAAIRSLAAGADLLCIGAQVDAALVDQVADRIAAAITSGELRRDRVEQAAARAASLAEWASVPNPADPLPADLGYRAAQRAVQVSGELATTAAPVVVQFDAAATIAEGRVPWGPDGHLPGVVRLDPAHATVDHLRKLAGDRPLALVGRHLHRDPATRALIEEVAQQHPTVVAEMGWPSTWRPADAHAFITTHGASYANSAALASVLHPSA